MPNDCRLLKIVACTVLCSLAHVSFSSRSAAAEPLASALGVVDSRLARIERAILPEPLGPPQLLAPTGRISQVEQVMARIHARLARIEREVAGQAMRIPQTVAPTGAADRRAADRRLANLDARVARIEGMIVGSQLPSPYAVSYTGVVYRSNSQRNVASLSARLRRIDAATRPGPDEPAKTPEESSPEQQKEDLALGGR